MSMMEDEVQVYINKCLVKFMESNTTKNDFTLDLINNIKYTNDYLKELDKQKILNFGSREYAKAYRLLLSKIKKVYETLTK